MMLSTTSLCSGLWGMGVVDQSDGEPSTLIRVLGLHRGNSSTTTGLRTLRSRSGRGEQVDELHLVRGHQDFVDALVPVRELEELLVREIRVALPEDVQN